MYHMNHAVVKQWYCWSMSHRKEPSLRFSYRPFVFVANGWTDGHNVIMCLCHRIRLRFAGLFLRALFVGFIGLLHMTLSAPSHHVMHGKQCTMLGQFATGICMKNNAPCTSVAQLLDIKHKKSSLIAFSM